MGFFAIGSGFGCSPLFFGLGKKIVSEWLVRRGIGGGGVCVVVETDLFGSFGSGGFFFSSCGSFCFALDG